MVWSIPLTIYSYNYKGANMELQNAGHTYVTRHCNVSSVLMIRKLLVQDIVQVSSQSNIVQVDFTITQKNTGTLVDRALHSPKYWSKPGHNKCVLYSWKLAFEECNKPQVFSPLKLYSAKCPFGHFTGDIHVNVANRVEADKSSISCTTSCSWN